MIDYIVSTPDICFGKPRIKDTRMTVQFLSSMIDDPEWPVARICDQFNLTPAQVYAAWSYYSDHKAEIDANIQREREESAARPPSELELKLKARLAAQRSENAD